MNFCSDNVTGAAPEIIDALVAGNEGSAMPYGNDPVTRRVRDRLCDLFETDCAVYPVATGSAANALALSCLCPPYGAIYCHRDSHINSDECGAPEMATGGAKLIGVDGTDGRMDAGTLDAAIVAAQAGVVHHVQPAAVSLTQLTESGTVYRPDEIAAIAAVAHRHGLRVHMDGARFANAVASLGCSPAEVTWKAGIDVLSFGATKNGCLAAEAVVFFGGDPRDAGFRRKRAGHLFSKMRTISLQLDAYLQDDLWRRNAAHANAMAARLAEGISLTPGGRLVHPCQGNEVFAQLPEPVLDALEAEGFQFYRWEATTIRLVCAFNTRPDDVARFIAVLNDTSAV